MCELLGTPNDEKLKQNHAKKTMKWNLNYNSITQFHFDFALMFSLSMVAEKY